MPNRDARAQMYVDGLEDSKSNLHFYYVTIKGIKVVGLLIFGIKLIKQ